MSKLEVFIKKKKMQYMFKVLNTKYRNNFDSNKRYPNM